MAVLVLNEVLCEGQTRRLIAVLLRLVLHVMMRCLQALA
jgi:hypothetical protein